MPKRMGRGPLAYKKTQQIQQEDEILLINEKNKVSMLSRNPWKLFTWASGTMELKSWFKIVGLTEGLNLEVKSFLYPPLSADRLQNM